MRISDWSSDVCSSDLTLRAEHDFGNVTLRNTARFTHSYQAYSFLLPDDSQGNVFGTNASDPAKAGGMVWRRANTRYGYSEGLTNQTDLFGDALTGAIRHSFAVGAELSWEKARRGSLKIASGASFNPRCNDAAQNGRAEGRESSVKDVEDKVG